MDQQRSLKQSRDAPSPAGMATPHGALPTFLVIGAMKAGTTSLYHYLIEHPEVFMPSVKEPKFFNPEFNWGKGLDWYRDLFRGSEDAMALGEASTTYSKYPRLAGVPARIARVLPEVKLIYVVRHPLDRARSQWVQWALQKRDDLPLDKALRENPPYLEYSRYNTQLEQYLAHFPADRLLVITSDALRFDRHKTMERIFSFIGVRADWTPPTIDTEFHRSSQKTNRRRWAEAVRGLPGFSILRDISPDWLRRLHYRLTTETISQERMELSADTEAWFLGMLKDEIVGLRRFLGDDFDGWGIA